MARRYARDNRGRFASVGATARGGRLATASGKKRETQTKEIEGKRPAGTIGKNRTAKPAAKGPMFDPKQVARAKRANANSLQAAKHEADGPNSKMSRKASVARRAQQIYSGKVDPKAKTGARLTKTSSPEVLRARMKKMKGNSAAKPAASRPDTAAANIPMRGSRGRSLDREISRNVKQQKVAERSADHARNRTFKTDQSRAKKLREVHVPAIAKAKGLSKGQVESALKAQTPSTQIKALKNWVKQNRKHK